MPHGLGAEVGVARRNDAGADYPLARARRAAGCDQINRERDRGTRGIADGHLVNERGDVRRRVVGGV